ncbi:unnamed protein product [Coregonus sp. 'balchen']|nr:unnamed protein product [Coregonus sp. 'balchen']
MAALKTTKEPRKEYLSVKDLEKILDSCKLRLTQINEVWPNIFIGNVAIAQNRSALQKLGITHVLNAAHSKRGSTGDHRFYGNGFVYYGIPAEDSTHFDLDKVIQKRAIYPNRNFLALLLDLELQLKRTRTTWRTCLIL